LVSELVFMLLAIEMQLCCVWKWGCDKAELIALRPHISPPATWATSPPATALALQGDSSNARSHLGHLCGVGHRKLNGKRWPQARVCLKSMCILSHRCPAASTTIFSFHCLLFIAPARCTSGKKGVGTCPCSNSCSEIHLILACIICLILVLTHVQRY
jgi:hypothetical protein